MKNYYFAFLLVLSLVVVGCGKKAPPPSPGEQAAIAASLAWLDLIDSGKYEESWEQASTLFKNSTTAEKWAETVKPVLSPMGKLKSREVANCQHMPGLPDGVKGEFVVIQFKVSFENQKEAVETVTPMLEKGKWKVSGYYIK